MRVRLIRLVSSIRSGAMPLLALASFAYLLSTMVLSQPGAGQRPPRMIRGFMAAIVDLKLSDTTKAASFFPTREVYLPGATVFARNLIDNTDSDPVRTDLSGRFTVWVKHEGRYLICWKADGFRSECSQHVVSVNGISHAYAGTQHIRAERRDGFSLVYGDVRMLDGSLPRSLDPLLNLNAFASVSAMDSAGNATSKGLVNNFGQYVLPLTSNRGDITLRAATASFSTDLKVSQQANLAGSAIHKIDLTIGDTPPRLEPVIAMRAGKRVRVAAPGSTVDISTSATDREGDSVKLTWQVSAGSGTLGATTGPATTWTLPNQPGVYTASVIGDDGKGGVSKSVLSLRADTRGIPFAGHVSVLGGAPAAAARIEVNGRVTLTNPSGDFRILVPDADRFVMNIRKQGFGLISRVFDNSNVGGSWTLIPATVQTADPKLVIRVSDKRSPRNCPGPLSDRLDWQRFPQLQAQFQDGKSNAVPLPPKLDAIQPARERKTDRTCGPGIEFDIPANSLVFRNGTVPAGNVQIALSTVDLNSPEQMPGDDTVLQTGGATKVMQSYGAGTIEISSGGQPLNLKAGSTATIRIPIDPGQLATGAPIPPTIDLLTYDERQGVWLQDGTLTRAGANYVGTVKHFSAFNSDLVKTNQSCVRVKSPSLPANYSLEYTIPQTGGAAPVVRTFAVNNASPSLHVIYNLPSNTNITLVPVDTTTNVPIGIFIVNTGGQQNPTSPNLPAFPYAACSTEVTLTSLTLPEVPNNGEFLHGLYSFEATNLDELDPNNPAQAALKSALDAATAAYYQQIDPRGKRLTLAAFKTTNGMPAGELRAIYANSTDLGFGRDMHCKRSGSDVACYVTNYGNINTADSADVADAVAGTTPVATVAMEYSRIESPPANPTEFDDPTRHVKFYVYDAAGNQLLKAANLDGLGARPVPQLCMVCHGGTYPVPPAGGVPSFPNRDSVKLESQFLPFDLHGYTYTAAPFDKASQQAVFKSLNETIVKNTPPDAVISDLIAEWYSPGPNQDENKIVTGWNATAAEQTFYRDTVGRTCRTCHVTNPAPTLRFDQPAQLKDILGTAEARVCIEHVMPHAKVTHDKFWKSVGPNMVAQLQAFGEQFKTPINGWNGTQCGPFTPGGTTPVTQFEAEVQPIFDTNCVVCHVGNSAPRGLNLSAGVSRSLLVNIPSQELPSMNRISPTSTATSYLFHKINDTQGTVGGSGSRMPPPPRSALSAGDIAKIQTWINGGALP